MKVLGNALGTLAAKRPQWLAALLAVGGLAAAVAIVMQAASALSPISNPRPLLRATLTDVQKAPAGARFDDAEALARTVLDSQPLESEAVSLLAVIRERQGRAAAARALVDAAAALSGRNDVVDLWLYHDAMKAGRYPEAFRHADALLRREPGLYAQFFGLLAPALNDRAAVGALAGRLAHEPPWRGPFFNHLLLTGNPAAAFPLLEAMRAAGSAPSGAEMETYLTRLVASRQYEQAYLAWIMSLDGDDIATLQNVIDGDFNGLKVTPPFGWRLGAEREGTVEVAEVPDRAEKALRISYEGYDAQNFARQLLVLAPGPYRFAGEVRTATEDSAGRLEWVVVCEGSEAPLVRVPAIATGGRWRTFSAEFVTPAGCKAQVLVLKAVPGERRATVETWYDRLTITPARDEAEVQP